MPQARRSVFLLNPVFISTLVATALVACSTTGKVSKLADGSATGSGGAVTMDLGATLGGGRLATDGSSDRGVDASAQQAGGIIATNGGSMAVDTGVAKAGEDAWQREDARTDAGSGIGINTPCDEAELVAFPCAEGYGKKSVGGRAGAVYQVTNLNTSGPGSFRAAVEASGPRTVVFRVSGTINGGVAITHGNITIAGQTAPGDGIQLRGALHINASDVVIRYIRVRLNGGGDAITSSKGKKNIILDHVSASWSSDEVISIYHNEYVTIQWSMITEAASADHKFGGIWGNNHSTYHHNLFAHNTDRNPRIASGAGLNDVRNNVIYNWGNESVYGGEVHQVGEPQYVGCSTNVVANYFKPGPGTAPDRKTRICSPWSRGGAADYGKWYVADNFLDGNPEVTADNWLGVFPQYTDHILDDRAAIPGLKLNTPSEFMPIRQQTAEEAYQAVLAHAGCSKPNRDSHDARIVNEVRTGTATHGNGFVSTPTELPTLHSPPPPIDSDQDGIPDTWETANGLSPTDASDRNKTWGPGYTMLEKYLNSIDSFH